MNYLVQSWTRCSNAQGVTIGGEESLRIVRVRHFSAVKPAMQMLAADWSVCRVTLTVPTSLAVWDLYRAEGRDHQLDSSMRAVDQTTGVVEGVKLDIGPGVTQEQVEAAKDFLKASKT